MNSAGSHQLTLGRLAAIFCFLQVQDALGGSDNTLQAVFELQELSKALFCCVLPLIPAVLAALQFCARVSQVPYHLDYYH